jgi:ABC-type glycerol-3-phosphate transport system permease component
MKTMTVRRLPVGAAFRYLLLSFMAFMALAPVYVMVSGSFKTQKQFLDSPLSPPSQFNLGGYRSAWSDSFPTWLLNSFLIVTFSVIFTLALAALAAWGFARFPFQGKESLLAIIVSLMVVPPVVLLIPLFKLGVTLSLISTLQIVVFIYMALMLPFSIYMLTNYFKSIPESIIESASIDGASTFQIFRVIVLPLSGAPLATLAVVNLLWAWNELLLALVFLQANEKKTLMVGLTGFQSRYSLDIPTVMAGMSLATLPLVVAYLFGQRYFISGLTAGSVKGE